MLVFNDEKLLALPDPQNWSTTRDPLSPFLKTVAVTVHNRNNFWARVIVW
jgi:hypothetical protein